MAPSSSLMAGVVVLLMLSQASGGVLLLVLNVACWNSVRGCCICNAQNCFVCALQAQDCDV